MLHNLHTRRTKHLYRRLLPPGQFGGVSVPPRVRAARVAGDGAGPGFMAATLTRFFHSYPTSLRGNDPANHHAQCSLGQVRSTVQRSTRLILLAQTASNLDEHMPERFRSRLVASAAWLEARDRWTVGLFGSRESVGGRRPRADFRASRLRAETLGRRRDLRAELTAAVRPSKSRGEHPVCAPGAPRSANHRAKAEGPPFRATPHRSRLLLRGRRSSLPLTAIDNETLDHAKAAGAESSRAIAAGLNARGVPTARGAATANGQRCRWRG